jgi:DNA-binding protein HU-beta
MTKQELVDIIATNAQITNKTAEAMLNAYTEAIMESLSQGLNVQLIGFGKFQVRTRAARKGRNPQTGEAIVLLVLQPIPKVMQNQQKY